MKFAINGTFELTSADEYIAKLKSIQNANLVDLWALNDNPANAPVALDQVSPARNASFGNAPALQAVRFVDGVNFEPYLNGAFQFVQVPTAPFDAVFNRSEGSILIWAYIDQSALDDSNYHLLFELAVDGLNFVWVGKGNAPNQFAWTWNGSAVQRQVILNGVMRSGWVPLVITWSATGNRVRGYYNGVQVGADQLFSAWGVGALTLTAIGTDGANHWRGSLGMASVWTKELTPAEVALASVVP